MAVAGLITDYGTQDSYVGEVKGAMLRVNPDATLIDLTHEVPAYNLHEADYLVDRLSREFPAGTVFVCVIDPGVGTARRGLALQTSQDHFFVGPDNGIFSRVRKREGFAGAWELSNPAFWRKAETTATFHGRDVFGPVGAHLLAGVAPAQFGPLLGEDELVTIVRPDAVDCGGVISGEVVHIDVFGNIVTNIGCELLGGAPGCKWNLKLDGETFSTRFVQTFADAAPGALAILVGSDETVEIIVNQASAAKRTGLPVRAGMNVIIEKTGP